MENTTEEKCMRAIEYFFTDGFIDELTSDKKHYTKILLDKVADDYNIKLQWEDTDDGYADSIELDSETHQANLDRKHGGTDE